MTFLLILLAVAVVLGVNSLRLAVCDDRGAQRPPSSHFEDPAFLSPSAR